MNTILFSKNHTKLPAGIKTAVLVAEEPVKGKEQTEAFRAYEGHYYSSSDIMGGEYFEKYDGDYLCLILKSDTGAIFTTLRKDNAENREKYMKYVGNHQTAKRDYEPRYGKEFQIIIKEG